MSSIAAAAEKNKSAKNLRSVIPGDKTEKELSKTDCLAYIPVLKTAKNNRVDKINLYFIIAFFCIMCNIKRNIRKNGTDDRTVFILLIFLFDTEQ